MENAKSVFISYAREDASPAERLSEELRKIGFTPWLDKEALLPGQKWRDAIKRAIEESDFFIALLSKQSINKTGFVQKELRMALVQLDLMPDSKIFLIPVRLEEFKLVDPRIAEYNYVDLFPSWESGFSRIQATLSLNDRDSEPAVISKPATDDRRQENRTRIDETASIAETLGKLDMLVGLEDVHYYFQEIVGLARMREMKQFRNSGANFGPLAFVGNPGTGKTVVARILAELLHRLDFIDSPDAIIATRSDLVAGYVGQTAQKTQELIESAAGSVLVFDEAYSLNLGAGDNDIYGKESLNQILAHLAVQPDDPVMIFSGYEHELTSFFEAVLGLRRRVTRTVKFRLLRPEEVLKVFQQLCATNGLELSDAASASALYVFERLEEKGQLMNGNALWAHRLYDGTMANVARRFAHSEGDSVVATRDDIPTLL